jgi:cytochrome b561
VRQAALAVGIADRGSDGGPSTVAVVKNDEDSYDALSNALSNVVNDAVREAVSNAKRRGMTESTTLQCARSSYIVEWIFMTKLRYTRTAVVLHWLLAALIVLNLALALSVDRLGDAWVRPVIDTHKSIGITVLGLALLRLLWRVAHAPPPLPQHYSRWEIRAAQVAHDVLYAFMIVMPLSGWMHDSAWKDAASHPMRLFGVVPWERLGFISGMEPAAKEALHTLLGTIHATLGYTLLALLLLHIAGALKHQWLDREPELQRMSL